jgi:hypothetical protein
MKKVQKAEENGEVLSLFDALEAFKKIEKTVIKSAEGKMI